MAETLPPSWDYKKYETKLVRLEDLDRLMAIILDASASYWKTIVAALQIAAFFVYLWARKQLIDEAQQLAKQTYEQDRVNRARDDLSRDDLDTGRKPGPA